MSVDRKKLARSLRLIDETPREIEKQMQIYRNKLSDIAAEEKKGIWGPTTLNARKQEALQERNRVCSALVKTMRESLNYIAENNSYSNSEVIDFTSPKLKDAVNLIQLMGKDLSYSDQVNLLSQFRGDVGSLRVLQKAFNSNGLQHMAKAAGEMQTPIKQQSIEEMNYVISAAEYSMAKGNFSFPIERATWTKGDFAKQLDKLGLDDDSNPYDAVITSMTDNLRNEMNEIGISGLDEEEKAREQSKRQAQIMKLQYVQDEMKKAKDRGEDLSGLLNRELKKLEMPTEAAQ